MAEARMKSLPGLPASEPISWDVRRFFGREGPQLGSPQWTLPSQTWGYIVLDESRHMGDHTSLVRLRPAQEKP